MRTAEHSIIFKLSLHPPPESISNFFCIQENSFVKQHTCYACHTMGLIIIGLNIKV
jgi:hypothetical protein